MAPQQASAFGLAPALPQQSSGSDVPWLWIAGLGGGGLLALIVLLVAIPAMLSSPSQTTAESSPSPASFSSSAPSTGSSSAAPPFVMPAAPPPAPTPPSSTPASPASADTASQSAPAAKADKGGKFGPLRAGSDRSLTGFTDAEEFQPRTPWRVVVDPPEPLEPSEESAERLIEIDFKSKVDRLVFPSRPSYFFAAVTDDYSNPEIRIFDWRSSRPARKFPGKLNYQKELTSLSADGNQMATVVDRNGESGVVIVDTRNGKSMYTIGLERASDIKTMTFAGPNRFLALVESSTDDDRHRVGVWNLEDETVVADFTLHSPVEGQYLSLRPGCLALSPGGQHFAVALEKHICFHEIETGELIGELKLPTNDSLNDVHLQFAPDGNELIVMAGHSVNGALLFRIDVATGEILGSAKVNAEEFKNVHYWENFGRLQFLRSLNCYLIDGAFIVEAETGETIYRIDAFQGMARVFAGDRVAGVTARGRTSGFAEMRLPTAEIEKMAAVFQRGGKLLDGIWGEAKNGSLASVREVELPTTMTEWTLPAWAPSEPTKGKKTISLAEPAESQYAWETDPPLFSQPGTHIAWLPHCDRASARLFAVDTLTGKAAGDIAMLPGTRAIDISPDGSLVIAGVTKRSRADDGFERLEVFSVPQRKHVFAWQMGGLVDSPTSKTAADGDAQLFQQAYFIDKNTVLTRMHNGRIVLWKLPEAAAQWRLDGDTRIVDFSPDRSYVQLHLPKLKKFAWLEVRSGKWMGDIHADDHWKPTLVALSPAGDRTASLLTTNGYSRLTVRDVGDAEGQVFEIPWVEGPLSWIDNQHVAALKSGIVFDVENGAPVWKITARQTVLRSPDGAYWLDQSRSGVTTLTRTNFPSERFLAGLGRARSNPIPQLVGDGAHVALVSGFATDPATLMRVDRDFMHRGWVRDENGPFRLNGLATPQPNTTVKYLNILTHEQTSVSVPGGTKIQITMTDVAGKLIWQTEYIVGTGYAPPVVTLYEGESLQQKFAGSQESLRADVSMVPARIFPAHAFDSLPSLTLTEKGEQF